MSEIDWSPARVNVTVTRGDWLPVETFTVSDGGTPVACTNARAQVRAKASRDSALVLDLPASASGSTVSFGGVEMDVDPINAAWDLQVEVDGEQRTLMAGRFSVREDVTA